jgi:poly [ADP-ribose] polymerase
LAGKVKAESKVYPPSKLDGKTQALVELMFDDTMFEDAMAAFDIDVKKMPLGNLSQAQVKKGYDVLLELR